MNSRLVQIAPGHLRFRGAREASRMTRMGTTTRRPFLLAFFVLLVISSPPLASALQFRQWGSLLSLSHSLLTRVADSRAARGDLAASERARKIAGNLRLLSVGGLWSLGWDFVRNYAWHGGGGFPTAEVALAAGRLLAVLDEARRAGSAEEMARWAIRRSPELVARADSLMRSLLRVFSQSGPLRDMMLVIKEEVAEGGLLKDCLEVGAGDLEGLLRITRDMFNSYNSRHGEL